MPTAEPADLKPTYLLERIIETAARETRIWTRRNLRRKNFIQSNSLIETPVIMTYDAGDFAGNSR